MLYKIVGGATIFIASLSILTQIVLLPMIFHHSENIKHVFHTRMKKFQHKAHQFDEQASRLRQLSGRGRRDVHLISDCPEPYPGPPGLPGSPGPDGDPGLEGDDGEPGVDARILMLEREEKCIICPEGPIGPQGPPGPTGLPGLKGDRGVPGIPGKPGIDGDEGPEGEPGSPGVPGKTGRRGTPGRDAVGGTGLPGPKGLPGPVGSPGPQGPRGKQNYVYGPPGLPGKKGRRGLDGLEGKTGIRGEKGEHGERGANAKFCPCPIELKMVAVSKPKDVSYRKDRPKTSARPHPFLKTRQGERSYLEDGHKSIAYASQTHAERKLAESSVQDTLRESLKNRQRPIKHEVSELNRKVTQKQEKDPHLKNVRPFKKVAPKVETTTQKIVVFDHQASKNEPHREPLPERVTEKPTTRPTTTHKTTTPERTHSSPSESHDGVVHIPKNPHQEVEKAESKSTNSKKSEEDSPVNYEDVYPSYEQAKLHLIYDEDSVDVPSDSPKRHGGSTHKHGSSAPTATGNLPHLPGGDDFIIPQVDLPKIGSHKNPNFHDWPTSKYDSKSDKKGESNGFDQANFPQEPRNTEKPKNRLEFFMMMNKREPTTTIASTMDLSQASLDEIAEKLGSIAELVQEEDSKVETDFSEDSPPETTRNEARRRFTYVTKRPLPAYRLL